MLSILKLGSTGPYVFNWKAFLRGQGFNVSLSGLFDNDTFVATKEFQKKNDLSVDGIVGNQTYGKAAMLGFVIANLDESDSDFPVVPAFKPIKSDSERQKIFGPLMFTPAPIAGNAEGIKITNNWDKDNLDLVPVPQLKKIKGGPKNGVENFHKKAAVQFQKLWEAWERADLLKLILTYDGAFCARFVRGRASEQVLSNHAFGTAFDINAEWNPFGGKPASLDEKGCVYKLVPLAHEYGFYWGGHFSTPCDGMHFEIAKIL